MQGSTEDAGRGAPDDERARTLELISHSPGHPGDGKRDSWASAGEREAMRIVRFRRTLRADRPQALAALSAAVELLRYPVHEEDPADGQVRFSALARTVTAGVIEASPGHCTIFVEFVSLRWLGTGGSAPIILPGVLLGAAVKIHDAWFARGFLNNVRRVLDGRTVGRDPARLPGMNALREMLDIAER